jgi:hypothetical protein
MNHKIMSFKIKKICFLLFLFFLLLPFLSQAANTRFFWRPEVKYPKIGTSTILKTTTLPEYIFYIFNLSILIGIIIAVLSLIYGGFLYISSGDNPSSLQEAKSQITASFLGLLILLTSHLVLHTLNPTLTIANLPALADLDEGFELTATSGISIRSAVSLPDVQRQYGGDFTPTSVQILPRSIGKIQLEVYSRPYYQGNKKVTESGLNTNYIIKSVKIIPTAPGVYLYGPPGREAKKRKIYLFPNPDIKGDNFIPTKYLYAPWTEPLYTNIGYSTTGVTTTVMLKLNRQSPTSTTIKNSIPDLTKLGEFKYAKVIDGYQYIDVILYPEKNYRGDPIWIYPSTPDHEGAFTATTIKSIKIEGSTNPIGNLVCPGTNYTVSATNGFKGNFLGPVRCMYLTSENITVWVFNNSTRFSSIFRYLNNDLQDFSKDPASSMINDRIAWVMLKNKIDDQKRKITDYGVILSEDPNFGGLFKIFLEDRIKAESPYDHPGNVPWDDVNTTTTESYLALMDSQKPTIWGKVLKPSSARVFEVNPNGKCQVILYKKPGFNYEPDNRPCIIIVDKDHEPIYYPKPVDELCRDQGDPPYEDNIYSIRIEGKCIVALTELRPTSTQSALNPNFPGAKSYVTKEDIPDVAAFPIGRCGGWWASLWGRNFKSCVSGIAIIPYK